MPRKHRPSLGDWVKMYHSSLRLDSEVADKIRNLLETELRRLGRDPDKIRATSPFK